MVDNVTANTSDSGGATFSTDDASGVHWPYTKIAFGADNTQTIVGSISSNPFPVQLSATDNAVLDVIASATHVDAGAFTDSTSVGMGCYGVYQETHDTVADDDFSPILLNSSGSQVVDLGSNNDVTATLGAETTKVIGTVRMASGGVASGSFASGALASGSVASGAIASGAVASGAIASGAIVAGAVAAGASSFVELEDVASAAADAGVKVMAKRTAAPADTSGTDGDYEMLQMDNGLLWTAVGAQPTGGMSYKTIVSAATNNETDIKTSAGTVYFISAQSLDATPVYVKFFNKTAANVTMGTDSAEYQFMIPANSTAANGAGLVLNFGPQGIAHSVAITIAIVTGIALDNNTAVSANEVVLTVGYK